MKNNANIRKAISFLQIYPIVTSLFVLLNFILDFFEVVTSNAISSLFGTSAFITIGLYIISRSLYVSTWAKSLYITLIAATLFDFADQLFLFSDKIIISNEIYFLIMIVGTISSLITFIYDKYKYKF